MAKSWNERYNETVTKSDSELESLRQERQSRGEETGVIDYIQLEREKVQREREEEENLRGYDQGYG
ncbi:MAG: hypothetical protein Q8Q23_06230 [bacterium]|nr:hypothetical protein [bacterium]